MTLTYSAARRRPARRWILGPLLACLGLSLLFATPVRLFGFALPEPVFALPLAFGWAALRPSVAAPVALLATGVVLDLLWGGRLGLWPLCLLAAHGFTLALRPALSGEDAPVLWIWYAVTCALAFGIGVLLTRLGSGTWPNLVGVGLQWLVSAALFPLAAWLMSRYQSPDGRNR